MPPEDATARSLATLTQLPPAGKVVFAAFLWVKVANMVPAGAVLQAGGDSRFVLVVETAATWCVGEPVAVVAAFALGLPVWAVYALLSVEEVVRLVVGRQRLRSGRWVRDLTAEAVPVG